MNNVLHFLKPYNYMCEKNKDIKVIIPWIFKNEYGEIRCISAFLAQMPTKIFGSCMFRDIKGQTWTQYSLNIVQAHFKLKIWKD